jgi:hypothetical protein
MEIAEDAEEDERKRQSTVMEERVSRPSTAKEPSVGGLQTVLTDLPALPGHTAVGPESGTETQADASSRTSESGPRSPRKSVDETRNSSQSNRPDLYSYSSYGSNGKPRVKLGPRPSLDINSPLHTSASSGIHRPISTLPAGLKLFSRGSKKLKERPQTLSSSAQPATILSPSILPTTPTSPDEDVTSLRPPTSSGRPGTSSGTSTKGSLSPGLPPKTPTITPEKARLMKALQMRKKQLSAPIPVEQGESVAGDTLMTPPDSTNYHSLDTPKELDDDLETTHDMLKTDSGVAVDEHVPLEIIEADVTIMSSNPASPREPSEEAQSTQASSISDSTDETIKEMNEELKVHSDGESESAVINTPSISDSETTPSLEVAEAKDHEYLANAEASDIEIEPVILDSIEENESEESEEDKNPKLVDMSEAIDALPVPGRSEIVESDAEESTSVQGPGVITEPESAPITEVLAEELEVDVQKPQDELQIKNAEDEKTEAELAELTSTPVRQLKMPRSKFSVQDLKAEAAIEDTDIALFESSATGLVDQPIPISVPKSPVGSTFSEETKRSIADDGQDKASGNEPRNKRKVLVEPIRTDLTDASGHNSENEFLSDDDLMDELQSATVEEAHPVSVSKSPITSLFPTSPKKKLGTDNRFSRVFSNPLWKSGSNSQMLSPRQESQPELTRSVSASAAYLNRINQQQAVPLAKKVNLGSGISQRIKALEKLNGLSASPVTTPGSTGTPSGAPSPAFFSVRKASVRGGSRSPSVADRANSLTRRTPSPSVSRDSSPEAIKLRERSGSVQSRLGAFASFSSDQQPQARQESISVTARIVRDPAQPFPQKPEPGVDPLPLDLKQSPLVIDHHKPIAIPKGTIQERRNSNTSKDGKKERRSSITVVKDIINERRSSFAERRKSITIDPSATSSARSSSRPPSTHANSPSIGRPLSVSSKRSVSSRDNANSFSPPSTAQGQPSPSISDEASEKKSGSRASRMLRRMSSSLSASRKSLGHAISPTVREESEPPPSLMTSSVSQSSMQPTTVVEVGDVNVQFPDTLLWKRRSVRLDSQGFLVLNQAQGSKGIEKSAAVKRYHLSEFRLPFVPDMELEEMPNSVVLDFVDGGGLQIACEDRGGQQRVLQGKPQ